MAMAEITTKIENGVLTVTAGSMVWTIDPREYCEEIKLQAMLHGLKRKMTDAAARPCDRVTGKPAPVAEKIAAIQAVVDRLGDKDSPSWNEKKAAMPRRGLLIEALCRLYPAKSAEECEAFVAGLQPADLAALRKIPKVADMVTAIKAERAKIPANAGRGEDLLAQLG